jgi:hypothetical protein
VGGGMTDEIIISFVRYCTTVGGDDISISFVWYCAAVGGDEIIISFANRRAAAA